MMESLLIANRGAIARRIIRTCRRMGVRPCVVYVPGDRCAPWVREADQVVEVSSYLAIDEIVQAAQACRAEAIHPGYGFLAENPRFAEACQSAGLIFIGPSAASMRQAGDKVAAKQVAAQAGVPTLPGACVTSADPEPLRTAAMQIGYPLLVKAAAGGGGKGMRRVETERDLLEAVVAAAREAQSAFADDRVFLEKYVASPRHIEFQILADQQGTTLHGFERECSLQRRHQKIIEEAPSPLMTPALRTAMGEAAVRFAKAVGYENAGTVEFLVDHDRNFYFLEMNARLQVEHAVTEMIVRTPPTQDPLDLVEWQLRIAAGGCLPWQQEDLAMAGHAIEARVYAEDATRDFLPCTGRIRALHEPTIPQTRIESGLAVGMDITIDYDPMLTKLVAWDTTRPRALRRVLELIQRYRLDGVVTNQPLLCDLVRSSAMVRGQYDTHTVGQFLQDSVPHRRHTTDPYTPWQVREPSGGWRLGGARAPASSAASAPRARPRRARGAGDLRAPMPGRIISVAVAAGASVAADTVLVVMEAMKMEYAIRAPRAGVVKRVGCRVGDQVALGTELVALE